MIDSHYKHIHVCVYSTSLAKNSSPFNDLVFTIIKVVHVVWAPGTHDTERQTNQITSLSTELLVTHLDCFHGTHHKDGLHHPGSEAAQQPSGAVQPAGLVPRFVTEELKHPEPEENKINRGRY